MELDSGHKVSVDEESLDAQGHLDISQSDARVALDREATNSDSTASPLSPITPSTHRP